MNEENKSVFVEWSKAYESNQWDFVGREYGYSEKEKEENGDAGFPMMNFAYPLPHFDGNEKTIKKIVQNTNCTIVLNREENTYYLALTGGGMDFSQDIAKAYILAQGYIHWAWLDDICISNPLSVGRFWFRKILTELKRQHLVVISRSQAKVKDINRKMTEYPL